MESQTTQERTKLATLITVLGYALVTIPIIVITAQSLIIRPTIVLKIFRYAVFSEYTLLSLGVLLVMIFAVENISARAGPILSFSLRRLWSNNHEQPENIIVKLILLKRVGPFYLILVVLSLPAMASWEEIIFRANLFQTDWQWFQHLPYWVVAVGWSMLAFGLAHMFSFVSLGESLMLGLVGGGWFTYVYATNGIEWAIVAHTSYNLLALTYMLTPKIQHLLGNRLIVTRKRNRQQDDPHRKEGDDT